MHQRWTFADSPELSEKDNSILKAEPAEDSNLLSLTASVTVFPRERWGSFWRDASAWVRNPKAAFFLYKGYNESDGKMTHIFAPILKIIQQPIRVLICALPIGM